MQVKIKGEIKATFVEHMFGVAQKTGRPYNFINLSNGIEKRAFSTSLTKEETKNISTGYEVTTVVSIDVWEARNNVIESII